MPSRRHAARTTKRVLDANEARTRDIVELVEVAPYGPYRIVRRPDCDETFLVKSATPDKSVRPGTTILGAVNPGGTLAFEAAPTGRGGVIPVIGQEDTFEAGPAALETKFFAFYYDDSTHITVKRLDAELEIEETTIDNQEFPASGGWDGSDTALRPGLAMISGDETRVANGSFTLFSNTVLYVVSPTGAFTEIFNPTAVNVMYRAVHWDAATGFVYIGTHVLLDDQEWRLYKVRTDGTELELVNSGSVSGSDTFSPGAWIWGNEEAFAVYQDGTSDWAGCVEIPFDGSAATGRSGDTPQPTFTIDEGPELFPAASRYFVSYAGESDNELKGQRFRLESGDATNLNWPVATFYAGWFRAGYAAFHEGELYHWPVIKADNPLTATEIYLLKYDPTGTPSADDLILMSSATGNPVAPFAVLPASV